VVTSTTTHILEVKVRRESTLFFEISDRLADDFDEISASISKIRDPHKQHILSIPAPNHYLFAGLKFYLLAVIRTHHLL
jgi:hypothetical protein